MPFIPYPPSPTLTEAGVSTWIEKERLCEDMILDYIKNEYIDEDEIDEVQLDENTRSSRAHRRQLQHVSLKRFSRRSTPSASRTRRRRRRRSTPSRASSRWSTSTL